MDSAEQRGGSESEARDAHHQQQQQQQQHETEVSADDDDDDNDDDDETIEFEIEIVSNNSSSNPGSMTDVRDEDTQEVEPQPIESRSLDGQQPSADITDQGSEQSEADCEASPTRGEQSGPDADGQLEADESGEPEYELEITNDPGARGAADTATSIEITINNEIVLEVETETEAEGEEEEKEEEEGEELTIEVEAKDQEIPIAELEQEEQEAQATILEPEMKLSEQIRPSVEVPAEAAQTRNDDLKAEFTNEPLSYDIAADSANTNTELKQPTEDAKRIVPMQPVGSKNIREKYKELNSDSVLVVGCRPEISEAAAQLGQELTDEPEVLVDQQATVESAQVGAGDSAASEQQLSPQSPEITIESSPERAPFGGGLMSRRCSGAESEDLEWEFDHEPNFEKRHVQVKRGKDPRHEYELGTELGRGKFGTVFRCTQRENGTKLAAKFVLTRRKEDREDVEREVKIMSLLQHQRLLQLYDAFDNGTNEMCLVTELVEGGELFERIIDDDFDLTEKKAAIFMRQICEGVEYMHSLNIVHLDMKPENILCISRTGNRIKLIDFGLARQLDPNETLRVMFGTPDFAAPEVLCYDTVSLATDMWSVGVICYVLLSGLSPFMGNNDMETMANVTRATYDFDEAAFDPITELAKDFIAKLLVKEQTKRLKPSECLQHPWLAKGGLQLEAAVRKRRKSIAVEAIDTELAARDHLDKLASSITVSLDKRNLKKYVIRRKWHKSVHAIMALGRMGAKLKARLVA